MEHRVSTGLPVLKKKYALLFIFLSAALLLIGIDAAIDALIFKKGSFLDLFLFNVPTYKFYLRLLILVSFILFGIIIYRTISKPRSAEVMLRKQSAVIESSMDGMAVLDQQGTYTYVSNAYARINGYASPNELIGRSWGIVYGTNGIEKLEHDVKHALQKKGRWYGEVTARKKDGSLSVHELAIAVDEGGEWVSVVRDITHRENHEERLQSSEQFFGTIFDSIRDPFSIVDADYRIVKVNEAYAQMWNRSIDDLVGEKCHEVLHGRDAICDQCIVEKSFQSGDPCAKEHQVALPDGSGYWVEVMTYPVLQSDGSISHVIEYTRDITERKRSEEERKHLLEELRHLSTTDSLTGLINRRALTDMLNHEVHKASRYDSRLSLMLCDIDKFKKINDKYGHASGDRALQTVSETLRRTLRKSDILGRYGGDEFMLILPETSIKGAERLAEKICASVNKIDFLLPNNKWTKISLSIGVSSYGSDMADSDALVKQADTALYASKQAGRNKVSVIKT